MVVCFLKLQASHILWAGYGLVPMLFDSMNRIQMVARCRYVSPCPTARVIAVLQEEWPPVSAATHPLLKRPERMFEVQQPLEWNESQQYIAILRKYRS